MALDFPSDTSLPYIDPVSGLKYVFNGEVGGWETAIQPPVIISDTPPAITIPGFLWWDTIDGSLFVLYKDADSTQWVEAVPSMMAISSNVGGTPPPFSANGDIWYDTNTRTLKIWENSTWIDVLWEHDNYYQKNSGSDAQRDVTFSHYKPWQAKQGDIWYNRKDGKGYIYSEVEDFEGWKQLGGIAETVTQVTNQTVEVPKATNEVEGTMRFATQAEVNSGSGTNAAITPGTLKAAIQNYISTLDTATQEEVNAGVVDNKAVTPSTLAGVIQAVPVGTVIQHVVGHGLDGYLLCDGSAVNRNDYPELFSLVGVGYGPGDGLTTFNLPNHQVFPFYSYIKY